MNARSKCLKAKQAKQAKLKTNSNKLYKKSKLTKQRELCVETHLNQLIPIIFKTMYVADGLCFDPESDEAKIYIRKQLQNKRKLNVLIEEITHAFFWEMPEYRVRKFSAQLGKIIYHLFIKK